jgi:NAD(P) transhydrogenase subunit alpha
VRTLLLAAALTVAQAVVALAQAPPTSPPTAPTTQPATAPLPTFPRPTTQAAIAQPKPAMKKASPAKPELLAHRPAPQVEQRETAGPGLKPEAVSPPAPAAPPAQENKLDYMSMLFVFMLATFIGLGVIMRVSRLLHTPLMSLTNAISAIAVVGSLMLAGGQQYSTGYRIVGAVAMFASMTNIISGFLITDRMLKMFKTRKGGPA